MQTLHNCSRTFEVCHRHRCGPSEGVRCKGDIAAVLVVFGTGLVDYGGDTVLFEAGDQYKAGKTAIDD
jgi:hypothetical protein